MAMAAVAVSQPTRLAIKHQILAEKLCFSLLRGPIARGILWRDQYGRRQFDFRLYVILGREELLYEIKHFSTRGSDGEFLTFAVYDDRSVSDSLDEILQAWNNAGSQNWMVNSDLVMAEDGESYPKVCDQRQIFHILINGLWRELDMRGFCHRFDETGPFYLKLRNQLDIWFPE